MNIQELFQIYNPALIKINSGSSCIGGIGGTNWDLTYNEIRILPFANTQPWYYIQQCIDRKTQFSVNIDQYISRTQHWLPDEQVYKDYVRVICLELLRRDPEVIYYCDITVDNEPLKDNYHPSTDSYIKYVKWCSQVAKSYGFKVSAGNEELNLAEHRVIVNGWKNLYYEMGSLKQQGIIDRIALHIQGACLTESLRSRWTQFCFEIVNAYGFKLEDTFICTEAAYTDPKTTMYSHWIPMFKMALDLRCSAIGFVFIDYDTRYNEYGTDYSWLAIFKNGQLRTSNQAWMDFRELSIKYKREIEMEEYLRPPELQALYDAFGFKTPYNWQTPNLYTAGIKNPTGLVTWADIDAMTETQLKGLISGLKKISVLPADFPDYPNIKYKADGTWNSAWQSVAKSNPI